MNDRVLFCRSNPIAPDPRVEKEAQALAGAGYDVAVLGWDRTAALPQAETRDGVRVYRLPIQAAYGTGLRNLPDLLRWQWGLLSWLIGHRKDFDSLHACDFDTIIPALLLKWFSGKKVVYDIFDFYADHLRATPGWIKKLIRTVDIACMGWADALILVDDARRGQVAGARPRRSAVIYNTPQDVIADFAPAEASSGSPALALVYVGLLQVERGLLEALEVLERHPEWSLALAGFGGDQAKIVQAAARMPNVRWHGRIPYPETLRISFEADLFLATYDPAIPNHRYASPNKVFEAMMLGKPVIVARHTNMDGIIQKFECGLTVDYGDVDQLEAALSTLGGDVALRQKLGRNARRAYDQSYSWSEMEKRLLGLYAGLG